MSKPRTPVTWYTADLHFDHQNILSYTKRPWPNVDAMNSALVDNWNHVVHSDDTVHVLGDFALGKRADSVPIGRLLNGHKWLYPGNHDSCWDAGRDGKGKPGRVAKYVAQFLEWSGFDGIIQPPTLGNLGPHIVHLSHLPPIECGDHKAGEAVYDKEIRFADKRPEYPPPGIWMLCGHVHCAWLRHGRVINVGTDAWDYHPVSEYAILHLINSVEDTKDENMQRVQHIEDRRGVLPPID